MPERQPATLHATHNLRLVVTFRGFQLSKGGRLGSTRAEMVCPRTTGGCLTEVRTNPRWLARLFFLAVTMVFAIAAGVLLASLG